MHNEEPEVSKGAIHYSKTAALISIVFLSIVLIIPIISLL
ncbi:hypothetical protein J2S17_005075 [Cytobacillus purgationiresistens]|uniref:Uncharacterized protein n=1 Tax=Cytobacillus purgationiresistens TaxID=863449 RepID=A0ABU0AQK4_9BACI|nr:hypothetical protein [Cytobacillus purgationiresistens]